MCVGYMARSPTCVWATWPGARHVCRLHGPEPDMCVGYMARSPTCVWATWPGARHVCGLHGPEPDTGLHCSRVEDQGTQTKHIVRVVNGLLIHKKTRHGHNGCICMATTWPNGQARAVLLIKVSHGYFLNNLFGYVYACIYVCMHVFMYGYESLHLHSYMVHSCVAGSFCKNLNLTSQGPWLY
jgi:hypothetical protein